MKKDQKTPTNLRDLFRIKEPPDRGGKKPALKKTRFTIWYFVIAILIIFLVQNYIMTKRTEVAISYSEFKDALRSGKVKDLTVMAESISGEIEGEMVLRNFRRFV